MAAKSLVAAALAAALVACGQAAQVPVATDDAASAVPPEIEAAVLAAAPDVTILSGEADDSDGEFEVSATRGGEEIEFDLIEANGRWAVAQIQRDVSWSDVPEAVRVTAATAPNAFEPVRVIESTHPGDNVVEYQLFSANDPQGHPSVFVRWADNEAALLPSPH